MFFEAFGNVGQLVAVAVPRSSELRRVGGLRLDGSLACWGAEMANECEPGLRWRSPYKPTNSSIIYIDDCRVRKAIYEKTTLCSQPMGGMREGRSPMNLSIKDIDELLEKAAGGATECGAGE